MKRILIIAALCSSVFTTKIVQADHAILLNRDSPVHPEPLVPVPPFLFLTVIYPLCPRSRLAVHTGVSVILGVLLSS